mmetsp:Transcript_4443/g.18058  ORF Transcript_4443/g.18058 Transcript_4443/m.18058 type:complete len:205 (+) Transcript_4443:2654-3268(+)
MIRSGILDDSSIIDDDLGVVIEQPTTPAVLLVAVGRLFPVGAHSLGERPLGVVGEHRRQEDDDRDARQDDVEHDTKHDPEQLARLHERRRFVIDQRARVRRARMALPADRDEVSDRAAEDRRARQRHRGFGPNAERKPIYGHEESAAADAGARRQRAETHDERRRHAEPPRRDRRDRIARAGKLLRPRPRRAAGQAPPTRRVLR